MQTGQILFTQRPEICNRYKPDPPMKILLADDDVVARTFLTTALLGLGHDVLVAKDGEEAWATLSRQPVPVVVSDWVMPKWDGLELCRKVRNRPGKDYVYFILLAVRSGKESYRQAMEAGVDDFLFARNAMRQSSNLSCRRPANRKMTPPFEPPSAPTPNRPA